MLSLEFESGRCNRSKRLNRASSPTIVVLIYARTAGLLCYRYVELTVHSQASRAVNILAMF